MTWDRHIPSNLGNHRKTTCPGSFAWQRATDFSGRSRRKEYWYIQLFNSIIFIFLALFAIPFFEHEKLAMVPFALMGIYGLICFVPSLSSTIRRLHGIGKSGW
jgi:uncharacterized membrane protein YhaH (DUF805 family)